MNQITNPQFKCKGKCGQMLTEEYFPRSYPYKGKTYRMSTCRQCMNRKRWPLRRIPLYLVQPYLQEILNRSTSLRQAARELDMTHSQLRVWLGRGKRYYPDGRTKRATAINRTSAAHIINTVRRLRQRDKYNERKAA